MCWWGDTPNTPAEPPCWRTAPCHSPRARRSIAECDRTNLSNIWVRARICEDVYCQKMPQLHPVMPPWHARALCMHIVSHSLKQDARDHRISHQCAASPGPGPNASPGPNDLSRNNNLKFHLTTGPLQHRYARQYYGGDKLPLLTV